jgi:hypothetical protein
MDLQEILKRHGDAALQWHTVEGVELLIRMPTRRQFVDKIASGLNLKNPTRSDLFTMVDRCRPLVEDWRGMVGADKVEIPFSPDLLETMTDEDLDFGNALSGVVLDDFNNRTEQIDAEKKP